MRTCVYCGSPLPETTHKGGRKREFCNDACKNRRYRQYKQEKHDADMLEDPMWEKKYRELYIAFVQFGTKTKEYVQKLEERLKDREEENDKLRENRDYWCDLFNESIVDCAARMKGLGISEETIKEYNGYWQSVQYSRPLHVKELTESGDKKKIQELEERIDSLKQQYKKEVDALRNKATWQEKNIAGLEAENSRLKDLLDEQSKKEAKLENILLGHGLYYA